MEKLKQEVSAVKRDCKDKVASAKEKVEQAKERCTPWMPISGALLVL